MARPDKQATVAELTEEFRSSTAAVLTEYRGLTVAQLKELRRSLGQATNYAVVKNTLTRIAAKDAGVEEFDGLLQGPSAIAFIKGDPVEAAKGLRDFAKAHPFLVIKGGVMDGKPLTPDEIKKLADLESREVLLAKLAGAMKGTLSGAVSLFAAPLAQTARLIEALRAQAEQDPSVLRGGAGTAAVEAVVEEQSGTEVAEEAAAASAEDATEAAAGEATEAVAEADSEVSADVTADVTADQQESSSETSETSETTEG